ncbi:MAG: hypothetical protein C5S52_01495 [ANME-2 cluster archaeon]|nr:hypothetical protein [ANME-2 cluster archaeon]
MRWVKDGGGFVRQSKTLMTHGIIWKGTDTIWFVFFHSNRQRRLRQ